MIHAQRPEYDKVATSFKKDRTELLSLTCAGPSRLAPLSAVCLATGDGEGGAVSSQLEGRPKLGRGSANRGPRPIGAWTRMMIAQP
eukprot:scaffold107269_cov34-Tisochrysis_lutea.AAC.1